MKVSIKNLATVLGICSLLGFLGGCESETPKTTPVLPETNIQEPTQETSTTDTIAPATDTQTQVLQVNATCIGCGKCARIASDTFTMQGGKSQVYSQENIDSTQVQQAIRVCPVGAIEIIEA